MPETTITTRGETELLVERPKLHKVILVNDDFTPRFFVVKVFHASSWSLRPSCYLEDLFVSPAARGTGEARALIEAAAQAAKAQGADRLYWHTQEFNGAARSLYDTLAARTSFIVYQRAP